MTDITFEGHSVRAALSAGPRPVIVPVDGVVFHAHEIRLTGGEVTFGPSEYGGPTLRSSAPSKATLYEAVAVT